MKRFAELYTRIDETNKTNEKVAALAEYFRDAEPADAAWAAFFLIGRRPRQVVASRRLAAWASEEAGISEWMFGECYDAVGDLAESIALILPDPHTEAPGPFHWWVESRLLPLARMPEADQRAAMVEAWRHMDSSQRFVWNKLITGAFRVGVSQRLVTRALGIALDVPPAVVAHRLMGAWEPTAVFFESLRSGDAGDADVSRPYPFSLAHPIEGDPSELGDIGDWQAEWKWDGIRAQLIRRDGRTFLWSRGEELITDRFPEIAEAAALLPDGVVLDGEIMPWRDGAALPFAQLQRRIGRKNVTPKLLDEVPVVLLVFDLLEQEGVDLREAPLAQRRARLEVLIGGRSAGALQPAEVLTASDWGALAALREESRVRDAEGVMLKRRSSPYRVGRVRGDWWKWKIHPYAVDAVLIYAQRGTGRRASLYTDYTFAVWDGGELVPFAKAYSGLSDAEIREVDAFVRRNTIERFGPVRAVKTELVFELAFEGIRRSGRHRSGVAVRFPRMSRWRRDKGPADADTLDTVRALLPASER